MVHKSKPHTQRFRFKYEWSASTAMKCDPTEANRQKTLKLQPINYVIQTITLTPARVQLLFVGWLLSPDSMEQIKIMPLVKFDVSFFHCVYLVYVTRTLCCVMLCCICIIIPREIKRMNSGNMHILPTNREFIVQKKIFQTYHPWGDRQKKFGVLSFFPHSSYLSLSLHSFLSHPWWKFHHHPMFMKFIYLFMKQRQ